MPKHTKLQKNNKPVPSNQKAQVFADHFADKVWSSELEEVNDPRLDRNVIKEFRDGPFTICEL